jgi:hypothetical protein
VYKHNTMPILRGAGSSAHAANNDRDWLREEESVRMMVGRQSWWR